MRCDIEVDHPTPVMGQHQEHVQHLETDRGHGKEVDGHQVVDVIVEEGAPRLRGRLTLPRHVLGHAGLADFDAQFEQFSVDAGAPQSGFSRLILRIRSRTSREIVGRPAWPCRIFQVQNRRNPLRCQAITVSGLTMASTERHSQQTRERKTQNRRSAGVSFGRLLSRAPKDTDLVPESYVLQLQRSA